MIPKIIGEQPIPSISECRVRFGHCGRSFLHLVTYKSLLAKIIAISGSVFQASSHFCSACTNDIHMLRHPLWLHSYRCCIFSGVTPHHVQSLVVVCIC